MRKIFTSNRWLDMFFEASLEYFSVRNKPDLIRPLRKCEWKKTYSACAPLVQKKHWLLNHWPSFITIFRLWWLVLKIKCPPVSPQFSSFVIPSMNWIIDDCHLEIQTTNSIRDRILSIHHSMCYSVRILIASLYDVRVPSVKLFVDTSPVKLSRTI